jgi:hypothetical protein
MSKPPYVVHLVGDGRRCPRKIEAACGRSGDEHLRQVLEPRDVWPAHEHGAAVPGPGPQCARISALQVWQAAWLPAGLAAVSCQAPRLLGAGAGLGTDWRIHQGLRKERYR